MASCFCRAFSGIPCRSSLRRPIPALPAVWLVSLRISPLDVQSLLTPRTKSRPPQPASWPTYPTSQEPTLPVLAITSPRNSPKISGWRTTNPVNWRVIWLNDSVNPIQLRARGRMSSRLIVRTEGLTMNVSIFTMLYAYVSIGNIPDIRTKLRSVRPQTDVPSISTALSLPSPYQSPAG